MIARLFVIAFIASLLAYLARRLRPSPFGVTFGLLVVYVPLQGRLPLAPYPIVNAVTGFLIALFLLRPGPARQRSRHAAAFQALVLSYLALSTIGLIVSIGEGRATEETLISFRRWMDPALFGLLGLGLAQERDRRFTVACMTAGYALVAIQAVREGFDYGPLKRIPGLLGQPNETGAFLAMYAPLVLALALSFGASRLCLLLIGIVGLGGWGLIFTDSRGALIAFSIGILAALLFSRRREVAAAALVLTLALYLLPSILPDRVVTRFETTLAEPAHGQALATPAADELDPSSADRIKIWTAALDAIVNNPLGFGFNSFKAVIADYADMRLDAHNIFLLVGVELGLVGLALVIALFAKIGINAWNVARLSADPFMRALGLGGLSMVLAAVVVNCFGSRLMQLEPSTYLWILGGITASARAPIGRGAAEAGPRVPLPTAKRVWWRG